MRNRLAVLIVSAAVALGAGTAAAENIKGKLGVTGRIGFTIPDDSDYGPDKSKLETDAGFVFGGGVIYGIDRNWAAEISVSHATYNAETPTGSVKGDFDLTDLSFGGQYRFEVNQPNLTPYVGAGLDILFSDFDRHSVDTTIGAHAAGGVDYFINRNIALNAEGRLLIAPETDINGGAGGNFDPTNFSGLFGVRFFFN